jgi:hypothetical protein
MEVEEPCDAARGFVRNASQLEQIVAWLKQIDAVRHAA